MPSSLSPYSNRHQSSLVFWATTNCTCQRACGPIALRMRKTLLMRDPSGSGRCMTKLTEAQIGFFLSLEEMRSLAVVLLCLLDGVSHAFLGRGEICKKPWVHEKAFSIDMPFWSCTSIMQCLTAVLARLCCSVISSIACLTLESSQNFSFSFLRSLRTIASLFLQSRNRSFSGPVSARLRSCFLRLLTISSSSEICA